MPSVDARRLAALVGVGYALLYLYLLGDLDRAAGGAWGVTLGEPGRWLDRRGLMQFEPIVLFRFGAVLWLFSPVNVAIAASLGALLAVNLEGAWQLWRRPMTCALRSGRQTGRTAGGGGALAALPALLAGGACCAPSLLLLLGAPSLGAFAGLFGWLVPVSLLLLLASRWWQRRQGAPGFFGRDRKPRSA